MSNLNLEQIVQELEEDKVSYEDVPEESSGIRGFPPWDTRRRLRAIPSEHAAVRCALCGDWFSAWVYTAHIWDCAARITPETGSKLMEKDVRNGRNGTNAIQRC